MDMLKKLKLFFIYLFFVLFSSNNFVLAEIVKNIDVKGNERISSETILMFSDVSINDDVDNQKTNEILKNLYESNFFENISVSITNNNLLINVVELPIIQDISFEGIKAKKVKEEISKDLKLNERSSFNQIHLMDDKQNILRKLKNLGYYFPTVETYLEDLSDNRVNLKYKINLGEKAKIKKISFVGDKVFKDSKLRNIIISEEYKFWKFLSGKKYLNENLISYDEKLLKGFYLNRGYFDVKINSSYAKLISENNFELIFNISANKKFFFNELTLSLPDVFQKENFEQLNEIFQKTKGKPYSINVVEEILDEIDIITINEEYASVSAQVEENIVSNQINLNFSIKETEKYFVEKINIFGNNITRENVIRNQLEIDEGDPYNEILYNKSENNLNSLNFFKSVRSEIQDVEEKNSKIINITVEEKATGEIMAGAGFGTSESSIMFGVKENNYLGKGISLDANAKISPDAFKGRFSVSNPNYKNSDKLVFASILAEEIDNIENFGYKTNKQGFEFGTKFEYLKDLNLGLSTSSFYEKIETSSTASATQQSQEGDYWDTFVRFDFDYDKRNQKFKTNDGFRSSYNLDLPIISKTNTLSNTYNYKIFSELYENNISTISLFLQSANSITGDDIKLSERLSVPSSKLKGFQAGKVGPKDGNDYIGGNYVTALNIASTLPNILPNSQNIDFSIFFDAANIWGVDYNSSLDDASKIRSSLGMAIDWFTPIGPLTFSLTETLSKHSTDVTESFRFNIGTTF
jgi:outer membrane protein insertion porin family